MEFDLMQAIAIVILCVGSAVVYGILHDQVTARVCVEYFTIGHPPVFPTASPTLLGIGWGIIATWWVGLMLGIPLAIAARAGHRPRRSARSLVRPIVLLLLVMGVCALFAGITGFALGHTGAVYLVEPLDSLVPRDRHERFLADLWAHSASYFFGFVGGIVVIVSVWRERARRVEVGMIDGEVSGHSAGVEAGVNHAASSPAGRRPRSGCVWALALSVLSLGALVVFRDFVSYTLTGYPTTPMSVDRADRLFQTGLQQGQSREAVVAWLASQGIRRDVNLRPSRFLGSRTI